MVDANDVILFPEINTGFSFQDEIGEEGVDWSGCRGVDSICARQSSRRNNEDIWGCFKEDVGLWGEVEEVDVLVGRG